MQKERIIMGIDPGTQVMGYGILRVLDNKPSMMAMGVMELGKYGDHYLKLAKIYARVIGLIDEFLPDELAIEAPFFGKNVQSMLKLGRPGWPWRPPSHATFPSMVRPLKIKMAITGNGRAAKEQVAYMLQKILHIPDERCSRSDASDGLAAACAISTSRDSPQAIKIQGLEGLCCQNQEKVKIAFWG